MGVTDHLPVVSTIITPLIGLKDRQLPIYKAIYSEYNSIYNLQG